MKERVDLINVDRNEERYVIPMHKRNFWTNKGMQEPRIVLLQIAGPTL